MGSIGWLGQLLGCDAIDLSMPVRPYDYALKRDLFLDAAAGFGHRERAGECQTGAGVIR